MSGPLDDAALDAIERAAKGSRWQHLHESPVAPTAVLTLVAEVRRHRLGHAALDRQYLPADDRAKLRAFGPCAPALNRVLDELERVVATLEAVATSLSVEVDGRQADRNKADAEIAAPTPLFRSPLSVTVEPITGGDARDAIRGMFELAAKLGVIVTADINQVHVVATSHDDVDERYDFRERETARYQDLLGRKAKAARKPATKEARA